MDNIQMMMVDPMVKHMVNNGKYNDQQNDDQNVYIYIAWWLGHPSEKYSSVGMIIPNIWENKKWQQTTNQL